MSVYTITDPFTGEETHVPAVTVACTTEGCGNAGVEFTLPEGAVLCGACGQWVIAPTDQEIEGGDA